MSASDDLANAVARAHILAERSGLRHRVEVCRRGHGRDFPVLKRPHLRIVPTATALPAPRVEEPPC